LLDSLLQEIIYNDIKVRRIKNSLSAVYNSQAYAGRRTLKPSQGEELQKSLC